MPLLIHLPAIALAGAASLQPAPPDLCKAFTKAEIAAVLGSDVSDGQLLIPGSCSWNGKGANLSITRTTLAEAAEATMIVEARKAGAAKDEVAKDETGIGQRATSDLAANRRTLALLAAEGPILWTFTLAKGDQPVDVETALPRLRELAKKALAAR